MAKYSLKELELVDAPDEDVFDNLTHLASDILNTPVALVSFVQLEQDRQYFKSQIGLQDPWSSRKQTPLSHSFCKHVVSENETLIVENALEDPLVKSNLAVRDLGVMSYLGAPIHNTDKTPVGALCVIDGKPNKWSDSDRQTLERLASCVTDAIRTKALLKNSEQMRHEQRDFTYAISHDIKSPFITLEMLITQIRDSVDSTSEENQQLFEMAQTIIARAKNSIENILDYTKSIEIISEPKTVDLNSVFKDFLSDIDGDIQQSGATIHVPNLPCVIGNEMQLRMLFQNLFQNALKYTKKGVNPIVVVTNESDKDNIVVSVSDNGIGIDPKYHNKIFNLFERLHSHAEYSGSGLGLALCRRVAANHDSYIDVQSNGTEGTTFTVRFPGANRS